jgi:hypothetical protein
VRYVLRVTKGAPVQAILEVPVLWHSHESEHFMRFVRPFMLVFEAQGSGPGYCVLALCVLVEACWLFMSLLARVKRKPNCQKIVTSNTSARREDHCQNEWQCSPEYFVCSHVVCTAVLYGTSHRCMLLRRIRRVLEACLWSSRLIVGDRMMSHSF